MKKRFIFCEKCKQKVELTDFESEEIKICRECQKWEFMLKKKKYNN